MSLNDGQMLQLRHWEAQLVDDSPKGKTRYLVVETNRLSMSFLVQDRWTKGYTNISQDIFRTSFFYDRHADKDHPLPFDPADLGQIFSLLQVVEKISDATSEIRSLLYLCLYKPQVTSLEKGWLQKYLPTLFQRWEKLILKQHEREISEVLST